MGGKLNPISIPSRSSDEGGSGGGGSGGMRDALSAQALFQELGVVMMAWNHSALAVR